MMLALYPLGSNSGLTKLRCTLTTTTVVSVKGGVPPSLAKTRIYNVSVITWKVQTKLSFLDVFFFTDLLSAIILCPLIVRAHVTLYCVWSSPLTELFRVILPLSLLIAKYTGEESSPMIE